MMYTGSFSQGRPQVPLPFTCLCLPLHVSRQASVCMELPSVFPFYKYTGIFTPSKVLNQSQVITPLLGFGTDMSGQWWAHLTPLTQGSTQPHSIWETKRRPNAGKARQHSSWPAPHPSLRNIKGTKQGNNISYLCRRWEWGSAAMKRC